MTLEICTAARSLPRNCITTCDSSVGGCTFHTVASVTRKVQHEQTKKHRRALDRGQPAKGLTVIVEGSRDHPRSPWAGPPRDSNSTSVPERAPRALAYCTYFGSQAHHHSFLGRKTAFPRATYRGELHNRLLLVAHRKERSIGHDARPPTQKFSLRL